MLNGSETRMTDTSGRAHGVVFERRAVALRQADRAAPVACPSGRARPRRASSSRLARQNDLRGDQSNRWRRRLDGVEGDWTQRQTAWRASVLSGSDVAAVVRALEVDADRRRARRGGARDARRIGPGVQQARPPAPGAPSSRRRGRRRRAPGRRCGRWPRRARSRRRTRGSRAGGARRRATGGLRGHVAVGRIRSRALRRLPSRRRRPAPRRSRSRGRGARSAAARRSARRPASVAARRASENARNGRSRSSWAWTTRIARRLNTTTVRAHPCPRGAPGAPRPTTPWRRRISARRRQAPVAVGRGRDDARSARVAASAVASKRQRSTPALSSGSTLWASSEAAPVAWILSITPQRQRPPAGGGVAGMRGRRGRRRGRARRGRPGIASVRHERREGPTCFLVAVVRAQPVVDNAHGIHRPAGRPARFCEERRAPRPCAAVSVPGPPGVLCARRCCNRVPCAGGAPRGMRSTPLGSFPLGSLHENV